MKAKRILISSSIASFEALFYSGNKLPLNTKLYQPRVYKWQFTVYSIPQGFLFCNCSLFFFFYYKNRPKISLLTNIKQNAWKVICRRVWFWTILWNFTLKCSLNNVMYAQNEPVTYSWRDHETWRYVSHGRNDGWYFNL